MTTGCSFGREAATNACTHASIACACASTSARLASGLPNRASVATAKMDRFMIRSRNAVKGGVREPIYERPGVATNDLNSRVVQARSCSDRELLEDPALQ